MSQRVKSVCIVSMVCFVVSALAVADAQEDEKGNPCAAAEYSQFDFWVGSWRVTDPEGKFQGSNTITKILDGCVLQESWTGAGGSRGRSFNIYAAARKIWHQTWVDANGTLLLLDGGLEGGRMVLRGKTPARDGNGTVHHEISWEALDTGQVRQVWRVSKDRGGAWNDAFVGIYTRVKD